MNAYGRKGPERKRPYTNACGKERKDRPQNLMLVAKKERANHKCWWQTKNGCPNQERNKTTETTSKTQTVCLPASIRRRRRKKGVDDYSHKSTEQK